MNKLLRVLVAGLCLVGFMFIRFRESELFYDPLINYFHGDYQSNPLPAIAEGKFFFNILLRFVMNMILSLGLLWAAFMDKQIIKFAGIFYVFVFLVLGIALYFIVQNYNPETYLPLFYVRRFLIQPLLVFLLLPAFFYSRKVNA